MPPEPEMANVTLKYVLPTHHVSHISNKNTCYADFILKCITGERSQGRLVLCRKIALATWWTAPPVSHLMALENKWNECGQNKYPKPVTNSKVRPMPNLSLKWLLAPSVLSGLWMGFCILLSWAIKLSCLLKWQKSLFHSLECGS